MQEQIVISLDVVLNKWATVIQISILLVLLILFVAFCKIFPRRVVFTWMMAWMINVLAILAIYVVLMGINTFPSVAIKAIYLIYALCKIWFAIMLIHGLRWYLNKQELLNSQILYKVLLMSVVIALVILYSRLNTLHIQILVYTVVGLLFSFSSLYFLFKQKSNSNAFLKFVFLFEGIIFLHHAWVLYPVLWGGTVPRYMTHISFFDSISELIVGLTCLFAITNRIINEISFSNKELENVQHELRKLVDKDPLTGLWNRRKLEQFINDNDKPVTLIYIDVNYFKSINDLWGHDIGDLCLKRIAKVTRELLDNDSGVFRLGGDEFLAVVPQSQKNNISDYIKQLKFKLSVKTKNTPAISIAIGIQEMNNKSDFKEALNQADKAMYADKQQF